MKTNQALAKQPKIPSKQIRQLRRKHTYYYQGFVFSFLIYFAIEDLKLDADGIIYFILFAVQGREGHKPFAFSWTTWQGRVAKFSNTMA